MSYPMPQGPIEPAEDPYAAIYEREYCYAWREFLSDYRDELYRMDEADMQEFLADIIDAWANPDPNLAKLEIDDTIGEWFAKAREAYAERRAQEVVDELRFGA